MATRSMRAWAVLLLCLGMIGPPSLADSAPTLSGTTLPSHAGRALAADWHVHNADELWSALDSARQTKLNMRGE